MHYFPSGGLCLFDGVAVVFKMNGSFTNPPSRCSRCERDSSVYKRKQNYSTDLSQDYKKMSAELYRVSQPGGNDESVHGTTVGGSKPLHRFLRGQPKIIGIVKLVVGSSLVIISIAMSPEGLVRHSVIPPGFLAGSLFILCGILYVLTEHNPTKKTVTISLALSIVAVLGAGWTVLYMMATISEGVDFRKHELLDDNMTEIDDPSWSSFETLVISTELVSLSYTVVGGIIVIIMSCLAVAALRSSKSRAVIVMTTAPDVTPADQQTKEDVQKNEQREEI